MAEIQAQSHASMLEAIRALTPGTYSFADVLDDVGPGTAPVPFQLALTVEHDRIVCDWTGTGPQREAGLNCYLQYTRSYCIAAIKAVTLPRAPQNYGVIRCIEIVAPEGSYVNPHPGAASGARSVNASRIYEVVMGALAQILSDRMIAASSTSINPKLSGAISPHTGRPYLAWLSAVGGVGAARERDGDEATTSHTNGTNTPTEVQEMNAPVFIERLELIPDSAGAGRFRGGMALRRDVRLLADSGRATNLGDRHTNPPYGLDGGRPGQLARTVLNPGTDRELEMHSKGTYDLKKGDVLSMRTAGAGGYGDPACRDPALVLRDVRAGLVSIERPAASTRWRCLSRPCPLMPARHHVFAAAAWPAIWWIGSAFPDRSGPNFAPLSSASCAYSGHRSSPRDARESHRNQRGSRCQTTPFSRISSPAHRNRTASVWNVRSA